jgi:hypothetical protein
MSRTCVVFCLECYKTEKVWKPSNSNKPDAFTMATMQIFSLFANGAVQTGTY